MLTAPVYGNMSRRIKTIAAERMAFLKIPDLEEGGILDNMDARV
jgi:hypothetical protein